MMPSERPPLSPVEAAPLPERPRLDRGMRTSWFILLLSLVATLLTWGIAHQQASRAAEVEFRAQAQERVMAIRSRMHTYQQVLLGGVGLFHASESVTAAEWQNYVLSLQLGGNYPGVQGIGYAPYVVGEAALDDLVQDLRAQGRPPLPLRPTGRRPVYVPIIYLEPFDWRNQRAYGYDMYSDPTRSRAIHQAAESGQVVISSPVTLRQETASDVQAGLIMYAPVYRGDPASDEERRRALAGFVYAPFRIDDLMRGILGDAIRAMRVQIYDGAQLAPGRLLYDSRPLGGGEAPGRGYTEAIAVGNHAWTVHLCCVGPNRLVDTSTERLVLGTGLVISLLLFAITWSLATTRERALRIAQHMTRELREERTRLAEITATLGEGLLVQDAAGIITYCNPAAAHMLGWEPQELIGHEARSLLAPEVQPAETIGHGHALEREADPERLYLPEETRFQRRDGSTIPVSLITTAIVRNGKNAGTVVSFHDMTEWRRSEAALQAVRQFENLFQYAIDALFLMDLNGTVLDVNRVALESLGYAREELVGQRSGKYVRWATVPQPGQTLQDFFETLGDARVRGEAEHVRKDGHSFIVEAAFSPITHNDRRLILVSARDISERKESERRIQRALDELERSRREVEDANHRLGESNRELQRLSRRDGLTAIANRRHFDEYLVLEWNRAARDHRPLSLLIADVDHFKAYNDRYGHQAGDECLRQVAATLDAQLGRSIDMVARYGGEEFVVVLPETPLSGALAIAERLRFAIAGLALPHDRSPVADHLTISLGAASMVPRPGDPTEGLVAAADAALYRAKASGRNQVCAAAAPGA